MTGPDHDEIDPERPRGNSFDKPDHFTGQVYDKGAEEDAGHRLPSGQADRMATGGDLSVPPEADNRASFDAATGAVRDVKLPEDGGLPSPPRD